MQERRRKGGQRDRGTVGQGNIGTGRQKGDRRTGGQKGRGAEGEETRRAEDCTFEKKN